MGYYGVRPWEPTAGLNSSRVLLRGSPHPLPSADVLHDCPYPRRTLGWIIGTRSSWQIAGDVASHHGVVVLEAVTAFEGVKSSSARHGGNASDQIRTFDQLFR